MIDTGNRRRLTLATITLGMIGAIVAALVLTRFLNHSGPTSSAARSSSSPSSATSTAGSGGPVAQYFDDGPKTDKLAYGMTPQQVMRIDGRPARIIRYRGLTCWQYTVNKELPAAGQFRASTINAQRVCFYEDVYSVNHVELDGEWDPKPTPKPPLP